MDDELDEIIRRHRVGQRLALATVVRTWSSSPRPAGAMMAVSQDGDVIGSVSGGCVEGAVYETATAVLGGAPSSVEHYGVSDGDAFEVGLSCGGQIDVFVEPATDEAIDLLATGLSARRAQERVALATVVRGPLAGRRLLLTSSGRSGTLGSDVLDDAAVELADRLLAQGGRATTIDGIEAERDAEVFVHPFASSADLLIFGAIDYAAALARMGRFLGYRVTVCDARATFTTTQRFPDAHEVVVDWPHRFLESFPVTEATAICVLTHDPKYDVPALVAALRSEAGYVGAMGSRTTTEKRSALLREAGVTPEQLARLRAPIGLDLGASSPEETAVSIAAEIIASRHGSTGTPLVGTTGPIHDLPDPQRP